MFSSTETEIQRPRMIADREAFQAIRGKRAAVVLFSYYPDDPRPRRAAEALQQNGMEVDVICLRNSDDELKTEVFNGVHISRVPLKRRRGGKFAYFWQYAAFLTTAAFVLACRSVKRRYNLVHVHNMPDVLAFSAVVPKMFGAKVILDLHDPMPELMMSIFAFPANHFGVSLLRWLERWSIRFADQVLTVNIACKNIFTKRGAKSGKVRVIMNAPDERIFAFRPVSAPQNTCERRSFAIMYHGSIVERHGLDLAVDALRKVRGAIPNAELRICGHGTPFLEQVLASIRDTELADAVRYLGPMRLEQIVAQIDQCDVGIIPNRRSLFTEINTPTRIFEYLSRGKPVVAPAAPGIQDYFNPQQLFFFALGDADDLARQLNYIYFHPAESSDTVARGQEIYRSHQWTAERQDFLQTVSHLLQSAS